MSFGKIGTGLILISSLFNSSLGYAGTERGGGHILEAAFARAIGQIEYDLLKLGKSAKPNLNFSINDFSNAASGISVQCATETEDLVYLLKRKKMAFVKTGADDKIINLNCDCANPGSLTPGWGNVLANLTKGTALTSASKVLIAHEVFRTADMEVKEGDYSLSSSIKIAEAVEADMLKEQMKEFLIGENSRCEIEIRFDLGMPGIWSEVYVRTKKATNNSRNFQTIYRESSEGNPSFYKASLLALGVGYVKNPLVDTVLSVLDNAGCYDGR